MKIAVVLIALSVMLGTTANSAEPVAVVELFTSEGCSSCPPADKLLSEIAADAQKSGKLIFTLAFHVDYWNHLGWADPFSDAAFSTRQHAYGKKFGLRSVYTPQMIVNGAEEFVGSDRTRAQRAIDAALTLPATVELKLRWHDGTAEYEVTGAPAGSVLNLAVVERGLVNKIARGENSGRTLRHDNVVRVFETVRIGDARTGKLALRLPASVTRDNATVFSYVQDPSTLAILGAASATLTSAEAPGN